MRQSLVPVLLLAAVALSSSNVLPVLPAHRLDALAINDNILRNLLRYNVKDDFNNILYTVPARTSQSNQNRLLNKLTKYINTNNDRAGERTSGIITENNYDGEGFRKEQWHNYPRQLDRLHERLLDYRNGDVKRSTDIDNAGKEDYGSPETVDNIGDTASNEYLQNSNEGNINHDSDTAATNPLFILKVHLLCLNNRLKGPQDTKAEETIQTQIKKIKDFNNMDRLFTNEINPAMKVKRDGVTLEDAENSDESSPGEKKTVNKRLFSLWSRLQSLSHKGHELPHRRHMAYYSFPSADSEAVVTAETRASLVRPPGSPLRWG